MSDTAEVDNTEVSDNVSPTNETTQDNSRESKPAGYHPVDPETASPEEVKNRIDYLYRQVKDQGRHINDYRSIAQQQSDKINELMNGMGQVVDHLQTKSIADMEAEITKKMDSAFESGDIKSYREAQKQIIDLGIKRELSSQQNQQKPHNQTRQQAYAGMSQISQEAAETGEISQEDNRLVSAWQDETDERGQSIRPWTKTSDPNDPDPDFVKALITSKKVFSEYPNRSIKENLAEVDRRMGVKQNSGGQTVMGGSLNTRAKGGKITLSPQQERIAVKTRFGANKGAKSDAEYIAAYRKQIETVQSKPKGAR